MEVGMISISGIFGVGSPTFQNVQVGKNEKRVKGRCAGTGGAGGAIAPPIFLRIGKLPTGI